MLKELRKYLNNKKVKADARYCEQVLGTNTAVHKFAQFWNDNHEDMDVIFAATQHEWKTETGYTSEELRAFMEGLAIYEYFFQKCSIEVETERQIQESPQV